MENKQRQQDIPLKNGHPDIEALMLQIRARVKADLGSRSGQLPRYVPPHTRLFEGDATQLLHSEELNFLNAHWNSWSTPEGFTSHRRFTGRFIVKAKNALRRFIAESLFKTYFERERQFQMQLVRHLNATARYIDIRDGALFWQLVQKMDSDIAAINERGDRLYSEAYSAQSGLETSLAARLETLESQLRSLEHHAMQLERGMRLVHQPAKTAAGPQAAWRDSAMGPVAAPAGLVDLTAESGIVDSQKMDAYQEKSLEGVFIGGLPFSSPGERVPELLARIAPKLANNARLVLESVNPHTLAGRIFLASQGVPVEAAVTPEVLQDMLETQGFLIHSVEVGQVTGFETLGRVESSEIVPARWRATIESINRNSRRINEVLFGGQMVRIHATHADEISGAPTLKMQAKSGQ